MAPNPKRTIFRNRLLAALSADDLAFLEPNLEAVELELRKKLEIPNRPIKYVYFPEAGFASVVANGNGGRQVEVGIIGREGMTGQMVVFGNSQSPHETFIQVAGSGQRIPADDLRAAMDASDTLRSMFLHYAQAFVVQTAHTALANGRGKLEERLARWLLMAHDRLDGDELPLIHEFLALMLAVRRPGVTVALQALEKDGLIDRKRGYIQVTDREGLEEAANGLYGVPEKEYQRLIG